MSFNVSHECSVEESHHDGAKAKAPLSLPTPLSPSLPLHAKALSACPSSSFSSSPSCAPSFPRSNVVLLRAPALLARGHGRLQSPDDRARARTVREAVAPDATASAAQDAAPRRPCYAVSAFSPVAAPSSAASASISPEQCCRSRLLVDQCHLLILRLRHRYIKEASVSISSI